MVIEGDKFVLKVSDSGAGLSPQNQARLFNEIIQFNAKTLQVLQRPIFVIILTIAFRGEVARGLGCGSARKLWICTTVP